MNKHLRSLHGVSTEPVPKKKLKDPVTVLTKRPLSSPEKPMASFEWTPTSDADLFEDEDIAEVLPRLRKRVVFWSTTEEDHQLVKLLRSRHPRRNRREEDSEDSFDEGIGARYELESRVIGMARDPDLDEGGLGKEVEVLGRSRWQVRYIMSKAKLMLAEEENAMRRRELRDLVDLERKMQAGEA